MKKMYLKFVLVLIWVVQLSSCEDFMRFTGLEEQHYDYVGTWNLNSETFEFSKSKLAVTLPNGYVTKYSVEADYDVIIVKGDDSKKRYLWETKGDKLVLEFEPGKEEYYREFSAGASPTIHPVDFEADDQWREIEITLSTTLLFKCSVIGGKRYKISWDDMLTSNDSSLIILGSATSESGSHFFNSEYSRDGSRIVSPELDEEYIIIQMFADQGYNGKFSLKVEEL